MTASVQREMQASLPRVVDDADLPHLRAAADGRGRRGGGTQPRDEPDLMR